MRNPLIQLPFTPYRDTYFDVFVNTEHEAKVCDTFKSASQDDVLDQMKYLESKIHSNPLLSNDPFCKFITDILAKREKKLRENKEWLVPSPRVRERIRASLAADCSVIGPPQISQSTLSDQVFDALGPVGSFLAGYYATKAILPKIM